MAVDETIVNVIKLTGPAGLTGQNSSLSKTNTHPPKGSSMQNQGFSRELLVIALRTAILNFYYFLFIFADTVL